MAVTPEQVADAMFDMVEEYTGKKKFKSLDLTRAMIRKFGEDECDKRLCKKAIRLLMDSGRCVYTFFGASYIELPGEEEAAAGQPDDQ